jgi:hypothetical protein
VPRVSIDISAGAAAPVLDPSLDAIPFSVRITLDPADAASVADADARVRTIRQSSAKIWIVSRVPDSDEGVGTWRSALRQWLRAHKSRISILELQLGRQSRELIEFAVRAAASEVRAVSEGAQIAIAAPPDAPETLTTIFTRDLAPYVDLVAVRSVDAAQRALAALEREDPDIHAVVTGVGLPADADDAAASYVRMVAATFGTRIVSIAARPAAATDALARAIHFLEPLLGRGIEVLDPGASSLSMRTDDGADALASSRPKLLFDNDSLATLLFYDAPADAPLVVTATVPVEGTPRYEETGGAGWTAAEGYSREGALVKLRAPRPGRPVLVDFNAGAPENSFAERTGVSATRQLRVEEIVARQRQEQAREDAEVDHYSASVHMDQHFRPTVTDPGYDVVTENRLFVGADGVEWEELSFSVNGSKFGANRPPFPLLQPEKVLSLPLQLRLGDDYRYTLEGTETVNGYDCYVVHFDPSQADRSLYRGTVWIDRRTFARVKMQTVQTKLSAPVVSNEEIQSFSPVTTPAGATVFLMTRLTGRQLVMIAGRNLLVERDVILRDIRVNAESFAGERTEARRGPHVMYKDTERGLRYFVKQGDERVVSDRPTMKAKAAAMGITLDPSYAFPLPIFGINYLNFSFGSPDTQLAMLFGGVLAAINIQRPKVPHTPFDASVDFFGIAVPSSDRRYDILGEHPAERVITWPLNTGLNLGWQYTPFQKATFQYQFHFDAFHADTTTSEDFVVPARTITNGLGGAYEYRRGGYSAVLNGAWYGRARWTPWGVPGSLTSDGRTYTKYSANLSRDFYISPIQKIHANGAYFGGQRLDRFSRYQFGLFDDTRIHGVPASGVRFDELAMARGSYTFDLLQMYRLDLFLERAWGRDLSASRDWQPITGVGTALNVRAPFNTILRMDVGHAWLPAEYRGVGSWVLQVLLLKPLGKS